MKSKNVLLLASQSDSRKALLEECKIPFKIIKQFADEAKCGTSLPIEQLVRQIALLKMDHVILPKGKDGDVCFVLTADTLSQDMNGNLHGKPVDRYDAIEKLKQLRKKSRTITAFCLDKKFYKDGTWKTIERIEECVKADYIFVVPDEWIDTYLAESWGHKASGAIAIEYFGTQFTKTISGSYSTIRGLPMFELRIALEKIGFFN